MIIVIKIKIIIIIRYYYYYYYYYTDLSTESRRLSAVAASTKDGHPYRIPLTS